MPGAAETHGPSSTMLQIEKQTALAEANAAGTTRQPITPRWLKIPAAVAYTGISRSREHRREDSATSTIQTMRFPASHLTLHRMNEELRACTGCSIIDSSPCSPTPLRCPIKRQHRAAKQSPPPPHSGRLRLPRTVPERTSGLMSKGPSLIPALWPFSMAKLPGREPPRIAVDTNYLLDCYDGDETAVGAWETIMERAAAPTWIIPPTAGQELLNLAREAPINSARQRFINAAQDAVSRRKFQPIPLAAVAHGIADRISVELRKCGLLPEAERNDSLILAESAILECPILITKDAHLLGADPAKVKHLLLRFDVTPTLILHPATVIKTWKEMVRRH